MTAKDFFVDSRAHFATQEEILKDRAKAEAFHEAIFNNPEVFQP